jgi:hypothetical protein
VWLANAKAALCTAATNQHKPQISLLVPFCLRSYGVSRSRRFEEPIELPDGRKLNRLAEAMACPAKATRNTLRGADDTADAYKFVECYVLCPASSKTALYCPQDPSH